jgi:hypothetical protein
MIFRSPLVIGTCGGSIHCPAPDSRRPSDERPLADLRMLCQLLSGDQTEAAMGEKGLEARGLAETWQTLRDKYLKQP